VTPPVVAQPAPAADPSVPTAATLAMQAENARILGTPEVNTASQGAGANGAAAVLASASAPAATEGKKTRGRKSAATDANGDESELCVYVDCIPAAPSRSLDTYVAGLCSKLCEEFGVPDVRCGDGQNHPLAFGKWKGVLAARVRATPPGLGRWWIVTRGDEVKTIVADALAGMAAEVVRGVG
jgi:hypothetical protein